MARTLREIVAAGRLPEGTRLPGHRRLAALLGVSRNTLVDALRSLEAEGYVRALGRSGTLVNAATSTVVHMGAVAGCPAPHRDAVAAADGLLPQGAPQSVLPLSAWARRALAGQVADVGGEYAVDFRVGQAVPELYPQAAWAQALARRAGRIVQDGASHALGAEADPLGPLETRRALAAYLNAERAAKVTPDMVMLTSGTQSALDALARAFLEPGRVAVLEDPTYPSARAALAATGAEVRAVAVDEYGLRPEGLPAQATLLYLTPGCQYPTTVIMPASRRQALIGWAREARAFILEDDYAADLHHAARPPSVMQGLAPDRVILLGSFSKSLAPVTRSGFLVAPPELLRVLAGTRPLTDRIPGTLDALALADLLASGAYARHLRRARQVISHRHEVLLGALHMQLPHWQPTPAQSGLHLYTTLPAGTSEPLLVRAAAEHGVALTLAAPLFTVPEAARGLGERRPAILLGFAHLAPDQIREGVNRLARLEKLE